MSENLIPNIADGERVLRRKEVEQIVGYGSSQIYALKAQGKFPQPIRLGANRVGWLASEVYQWLAERVAETRNSAEV